MNISLEKGNSTHPSLHVPRAQISNCRSFVETRSKIDPILIMGSQITTKHSSWTIMLMYFLFDKWFLNTTSKHICYIISSARINYRWFDNKYHQPGWTISDLTTSIISQVELSLIWQQVSSARIKLSLIWNQDSSTRINYLWFDNKYHQPG